MAAYFDAPDRNSPASEEPTESEPNHSANFASAVAISALVGLGTGSLMSGALFFFASLVIMLVCAVADILRMNWKVKEIRAQYPHPDDRR